VGERVNKQRRPKSFGFVANHLTNLGITLRLDFWSSDLRSAVYNGESESGLLKVQTFFTCLKLPAQVTRLRAAGRSAASCPTVPLTGSARRRAVLTLASSTLKQVTGALICTTKISKTMCLRWIRFCPRSLMFTKAFPYYPCRYSVYYTNCFISKITYISFLRINIIYYQPK
jgi:hypothetical protein